MELFGLYNSKNFVHIIYVYNIHILYVYINIIGTEDYLCPLDARDLNTAYEYAVQPDPPGSDHVHEHDDNHLTTFTQHSARSIRSLCNSYNNS